MVSGGATVSECCCCPLGAGLVVGAVTIGYWADLRVPTDWCVLCGFVCGTLESASSAVWYRRCFFLLHDSCVRTYQLVVIGFGRDQPFGLVACTVSTE